jgi:sugar phosphate isomerase/epimerase
MTFSTLPLSYCTNVHPGRTVDEVVDGLTEFTAEVRRQLDAPMAAGLWLSRAVVTELLEDATQLERLAQTLWQHDLCCYTLNAFPYGDFHDERVKENVYLPDWASAERLKYTKDCATILSQLMPAGSEGSISTVPLGGKMNPTRADFHATCFRNLIHMARFLKELQQETGRTIRLAVEPEPMCQISSVVHDAVPQFNALFEMADALGCEDDVREYIGICLDVCHQSVEFEVLPQSIDQLVDIGIRLNKIHITNAVELRSPSTNPAGLAALAKFVEPRYLHQTYAKMKDGTVQQRLDLTIEDLQQDPPDDFLQADIWRVHFHVPVYADEIGPLHTTRPDLKAALQRVQLLQYAPHLEVETYTWPVMPDTDAAETNLAAQITRELRSAYDLLSEISG